MPWLLRSEMSHRCEIPPVIDEEKHREGLDRADEANRTEWERYQRSKHAWDNATVRERRNLDRPEEPGGPYGRHEHDCDREKCRTIRDGSVWQCDDCGLTYEVAKGRWVRVSLIRPTVQQAGTQRRGASSGDVDPVLAFAAGAVLL